MKYQLIGFTIIIFVGILFYWIIPRIREKVEKDDTGDSNDKKKTDDEKSLIEKAKEKFKKNRNRILIGGFSYIALHVALIILLPKVWVVYWGHQDFFWILQVYLAAMIALKWLDIWSVKWFIRIAFTIILWMHLGTILPKPPPNDDTGTEVVQTYTQQRETRNGVETRYVIAPAGGNWSKAITIPDGYDWSMRRDESYGLDNIDRIVAIRANGNLIKKEKRLTDGTTQGVKFGNVIIYTVEFTALEKPEPIYLALSFVKKH